MASTSAALQTPQPGTLHGTSNGPTNDDSLERFKQTMGGKRAGTTNYKYNIMLKKLRVGATKETKKDLPIEEIDPCIILQLIDEESYHPDGTRKSVSTPDGYRCAIMAYYSDRGMIPPIEYATDLRDYVTGFKNGLAKDRQEGTYKATEGKDPMLFGTFNAVAEKSIQDNYADGHAFLVLCWNMTVRGDSVGSSNFSHFTWAGDCIQVDIPKEKTKQAGANRGRSHEIRIYSNPCMPAVDVFLALIVKMICSESMPEGGALFDHKNINDKYAKWLSKLVDKISNGEASELGYDKETSDFGAHSIRKGVLSYLMSYPDSIATMATMIRAGLSLGGVLPRYIHGNAGGDSIVGRLACGLNPLTSESALLPARFKPNVAASVDFSKIVPDYERYPPLFKPCIPYLVASLIHHHEWIKSTFPSNHRIFLSRYWISNIYHQLKNKILPPCIRECPITDMRATGLNTQTVLLCEIEELNKKLDMILQQSQLSSKASQYQSELDALKGEMNSKFDIIISKLDNGLQQQSQAVTSSGTVETVSLSQPMVESEWPKDVKIRTLYELWYCGNPSKSFGPYRFIETGGFSQATRKIRSMQNRCISVVNKMMSIDAESFIGMSASEQDAYLHNAIKKLCEELVIRGCKWNVSDLMVKFNNDRATSMYENYLRKYKILD